MCFNSSNNKRAEQIARKYGRKTNVIEIFQEIMEEKRRNGEILDLTDGAYNIPAYSSPYVSIVTESDELQSMRWGLIRATTRDWKTVIDKDRKNWNKNARAENISAKWPYKKRCIIPCTGFFEWHENESGRKEPYYIHLPEDEVFSVGGLWDEWINPETGEAIHSYVMITTEANELMRQVHNSGLNPFRMPFILRKETEEVWLDSKLPLEGVQELLQVYPHDGM